MKIGVIPTGTAELAGFPAALERIFPGHEFASVPKRRRSPAEPYDGFTSSRIDEAPVDLDSSAGRIVRGAAAELEVGRFDFVVIVDDLELANFGMIESVIQYLRATVKAHLEMIARADGPHEAALVAERLRTRASFHVAVPMLESWFFADPTALERIGVVKAPVLVEGADPEAFRTNDPEYDADDCAGCTAWHAISDPRRKRNACPEWARDERHRHPKAYLAWLLKDPSDKRCSRYRETDQGSRALMGLEWERALANPSSCAYMRALVHDVSIALKYPLPWLIDSSCPALTEYKWPGNVLRNI